MLNFIKTLLTPQSDDSATSELLRSELLAVDLELIELRADLDFAALRDRLDKLEQDNPK